MNGSISSWLCNNVMLGLLITIQDTLLNYIFKTYFEMLLSSFTLVEAEISHLYPVPSLVMCVHAESYVILLFERKDPINHFFVFMYCLSSIKNKQKKLFRIHGALIECLS